MPAFYPMPPQAFVSKASAALAQQLPNWLTDTGATYHMSGNPANAATSTPLTGQEHMFIGNGQGLPIHSICFESFPSTY